MNALPDDLIYNLLRANKLQEINSLILKKTIDIDHIFTETTDILVHGQSLLNVAVSFQNISMVQLLLNLGCDVNIVAVVTSIDVGKSKIEITPSKDCLQHTALYQALRCQNAELMEILVDKGADVNMQDSTGCTAVWHAVDTNQIGIARACLEAPSCDVSAENTLKLTPLYAAALHGNIDILTMIVNRGSIIDSKQLQGATALFVPCVTGSYATTKFLLQHGANPNIIDDDYYSPLYISLVKGFNAELVYLLLFAGTFVQSSLLTYKEDKVSLMDTNEEVKDAIHFYINTPRELKVLTSLAIKSTLTERSKGKTIHNDILMLQLPLVLTDYLQLNEC